MAAQHGVRILHTADWQLGKQFSRFPDADRHRYAQARIDVLGRIASVAATAAVDAVVVAGDVFESNLVDRGIIARATDALQAMPCPVFLLPGNHDALDPTTLLGSVEFQRLAPAHVHVLDAATVVPVTERLELLAAPLLTRHPDRDVVAAALDGAPERTPGVARVLVGHGMVDSLTAMVADRAVLSLERMEAALTAGEVDYIALGDRHSWTDVGGGGRIYYSGSPEVTDYDDVETDSGKVAVVELLPEGTGWATTVTAHTVGQWALRTVTATLNSAADIERLEQQLNAMPNKSTTAVRYQFTGTLTLAEHARLEALVADMGLRFAALRPRARQDLVVLADDSDFAGVGLSGYASAAVAELSAAAATDPLAQAAVRTLYRHLTATRDASS